MKATNPLLFALLLALSPATHAVGIGQVLGLPFELGSPQSAVEKAGFKCVPIEESNHIKKMATSGNSMLESAAREWVEKFLAECTTAIAILGIAKPQYVTVRTDALSGEVVHISADLPATKAAFDLARSRMDALGLGMKVTDTSGTQLNACMRYQTSLSGTSSDGRIYLQFSEIETNGCPNPAVRDGLTGSASIRSE